MERGEQDETDDHVEMSPTDARQGEPDMPVVYVLIGLIVGTVLAVGAVFAYFF